MNIIIEIIHRFYCLTQRSKRLYNFSIKLVKIYCKFSKKWNYEGKNYLGKIYITKQISYGISWYKFEKFGTKWSNLI